MCLTGDHNRYKLCKQTGGIIQNELTQLGALLNSEANYHM